MKGFWPIFKRELFSLDPDPEHSYSSQAVDRLRELYPPPAPAEASAESLAGLTEASAIEA